MVWLLSSSMPDRYIDCVDVVEEEAIQSTRQDELSKVEKENAQLKHSLNRLETGYSDLNEKLSGTH